MIELSLNSTEQGKTACLSKRVAGLLLGAVLFGGVLLVTALLPGRYRTSTPPVYVQTSNDWLETGKGITRGVGGLSLFDMNPERLSFLAVFDSKLPGEPRLAIMDLAEGKLASTQDLQWPGDKWPVDLEAITQVPGQTGVFVAATSAGELWRLRVLQDRGVTILGTTELPLADAPEIEGLDIKRLEGKLVIVWAGRGDGQKSAVVCAGFYDEATGAARMTHRSEFRAPWPDQQTVRHISDLRLDTSGVLIVTSTMDPGNDGPFDSALYVAGKVELENGVPVLRVNDPPVHLRTDYGHKVEALEFVPAGIGGLILGSDNENRGGAILPAWRKR